ncbi:MAG: enoyl-CoA hydratase/isomerase family protein [Burkholderiales bacterium]|nr:enoyl-CoA hydratase/isomerase family protein [Burkholderiales bacterium]
MDHQTLLIQPAPGTVPEDGIRCLVLNRPDVMNAMNTQMFVDLRNALHELAFDDGLRVLIITGAGERAFCTGGDLKQRDGMTDAAWRRQHQLAEEVLLAVKDFPRPVIAAVEGHAHGGGCELALMCDWIVAARTAVFSLPEVRRGIMPGGGGIQNLVRAVGARRAKLLLLTARRFSSEQAAAWNMVTTLAETGQALAVAVAEAREISLAAPMAVHYAKLAASRGGEVDFHTGYALDIAAYNVLVSSQDRLEGVKAFNEKRAPRWSGR